VLLKPKSLIWIIYLCWVVSESRYTLPAPKYFTVGRMGRRIIFGGRSPLRIASHGGVRVLHTSSKIYATHELTLPPRTHSTNTASSLYTAVRHVIVFDQTDCSLPQNNMQLMSTGSESVKAQVVDKIPKRIKELQFGIQYVLCPDPAYKPSN
jgi:hypothetical protein